MCCLTDKAMLGCLLRGFLFCPDFFVTSFSLDIAFIYMMLSTSLLLNIYLFYGALASDVSDKNLKAMSKKEVKGLDDRLNVRNDVKVLVCDPGRVTVL